MKILHVIETLGRGGAEQALCNLIPALNASGVESHVAILYSPYTLAVNLENYGVVVHRLNVNHRWNLLQSLNSLTRLCRNEKFDVVHAHLFFATINVALSKILFAEFLSVVSFHQMEFDSYPARTLWSRLRKDIQSFCVRNLINKTTAVSQAVAQHYCSHLGITKPVVIPNAIRLPEINDVSDESAKASIFRLWGYHTKFLILIPGMLVKEKGHIFALQAMHLLKQKGREIQMLIIGDGPTFEQIQVAISEYRLNNDVKLHPAVPVSELFEFMLAADLVVIPSVHEGWGMVAAEAMALGRPVVVTDVGGLPEIVENEVSGLVVPSSSYVVLASAIERLMADSALRNHFGIHARQRIQDNFSVEIVVQDWVRLYNDLLNSQD